jgi:heptaprenylglyceryl phosphate synthase
MQTLWRIEKGDSVNKLMYLAYMRFEKLNDKKLDPATSFAIIGKDSEDIAEKATQYGTDPYFVSGMHELNQDWVTFS